MRTIKKLAKSRFYSIAPGKNGDRLLLDDICLLTTSLSLFIFFLCLYLAIVITVLDPSHEASLSCIQYNANLLVFAVSLVH